MPRPPRRPPPSAAPALQHGGEMTSVGRVVVHDQHARRRSDRHDRRQRDRLGLRAWRTAVEPERRSRPELAFDPDGAAHHLDQLLGDGQAQPGAAVLAGGGAVDLGERGEQGSDSARPGMPMPVSRMAKLQLEPPRSSVMRGTGPATPTSPWWVNLMALPTRLTMIWRRRPGSPLQQGRAPRVPPGRSSSRPFSCAVTESISTVSSTVDRRSKSMSSSSSLPASILEKSSMSLMMVSSASPLERMISA